jgi:hypothetical protein
MYDLSIVFCEPVNKLEKRISNMPEAEAMFYRSKLDEIIAYDNKLAKNKDIQTIWVKLNNQLKESEKANNKPIDQFILDRAKASAKNVEIVQKNEPKWMRGIDTTNIPLTVTKKRSFIKRMFTRPTQPKVGKI